MAYDYDKVKSQYESLNEQQKQQFANMKGGNVQDFLTRYNAEKAQATTTPTTPTTAMPEYQGTGTNKANTYQNQGDGNYSYDTGTQYYEKQGTNDSYSKIRDKWDSLSYAEQQEKLKQNPNLREGVKKVGGVFKTEEPTSGTTPATGTTGATGGQAETTPKQWDYQDNSPERMAEIASNLEGYKQTMPYLFNDKNAFDNFFINGKGRSQDQIDFLNDWFYKNQKYGKYDALTPDSIGYGIAYGDIPEDYLTMLKTTDPAKYQAVLQAKQDAEDKIKDKTALDTTNILSGDNNDTITAKFIERAKSLGILIDKDGNLIDDRTENYATDEEKGYAKNAADIIARNLDIDNTVKHTYEDLVKAHPGATKATLMAMAQDINADLLREKENNNVELTRLQGYMGYMQTERKERTRIGENAINQLQKQYGMYYQYTPEGMSELAQAKYSATNVTLDQADNGTDTQKQMALQSVLDDYYAKYGDIIQRSEAQVINDVMALAKQKGISLSQALEENFLSQLRKKPGFEQLSTIATKNPEIVKVGDNAYAYWDDNGNLVSVGGTLGANGVYQFSESEVRTGDTIGNDINSIGHILNSEDGLRVGTYKSPNGYTYNVYATREDGISATENLLKRGYYGMTLGDAAQKWIGQGKDITAAKNIIKKEGLSLNEKLSDANVRKFIEAMGTREGTLKGQSLDEWAKGGKTLGTPKGTEGGQKRNPELETFLDKWKDAEGDRLKEKDFWATYGKELEAKGVSKESFIKQFKEYYAYETRDAKLDILSDLDHLIELTGAEFDLGEKASVLIGKGTAGVLYNRIKNNLTLDNLIKQKNSGAKLGVLSDSDVRMIADAASTLDWSTDKETWNKALQDFRQSLLNSSPYLKEKYKYQSAYSPNRGFKYNDNDRSFTFGTRKDDSGTQGETQGATPKGKSIKDLTKVNR